MFEEWGFLLAEIWGLLALAALIGLIAGWLIFGGRPDTGADVDEIRRLYEELDREKARGRASVSDPTDDVPAMQGGGYVRPKPVAPTPAAPATPIATPEPDAAPTSGTKPQGLAQARDGLPDDLTKIKGIGAKMEKLCNSLGFWHYDQIALWTEDEIAWVDENLEGFKGRATRDNWVAQAKAMTGASTPAFVRRKD